MRPRALTAIVFLLVLSTALTTRATAVQPKPKSNYGGSPNLTDVGSPETSGGATLQLVCPVSFGCPSVGAANLLEVTFPGNLTPGALFDINGIDTSQEVDLVCDFSLIGSCNGGTLSSAQLNCVATVGGTVISASTYQVAMPNCSTFGFSGTSMVLIFGLANAIDSIPSSISVSPASVTSPEPAPWMLFAIGVAALIFKRRALTGNSAVN